MDINEQMRPGPAIDAMIAKDLMGFDVMNCANHEKWFYIGDWEEKTIGGIGSCACNDPYWSTNSKPLPKYSSDLGASMEVFNKLSCLRDGYGILEGVKPMPDGGHHFYKPLIRIEWYEHDEIAHCWLGRCKAIIPHGDYIYFQSYTIPMAICGVALKVIAEIDHARV